MASRRKPVKIVVASHQFKCLTWPQFLENGATAVKSVIQVCQQINLSDSESALLAGLLPALLPVAMAEDPELTGRLAVT